MKYLILILLIMKAVMVHGHGSKNHQQAIEQTNAINGEVTYLGNTGLLVSHGDQQILFDPFFHNHYNHYQLVPDEIRMAIFAKQAPYETVEMIFISHAHGDHFDAKDVVKFLQLNPQTKLVAPNQAVEQMKAIDGFNAVLNQITAIKLVYGDQPIEQEFGAIKVGAVRIPHAGWPGRADVSNLVYRVTLNNQLTVMHMGDADPDDVHFKPWASYWERQVTGNAFPPYWFLTSPTGKKILSERINALHATGVHVPVEVPNDLRYSEEDYFFEPGKVKALTSKPEKANK